MLETNLYARYIAKCVALEGHNDAGSQLGNGRALMLNQITLYAFLLDVSLFSKLLSRYPGTQGTQVPEPVADQDFACTLVRNFTCVTHNSHNSNSGSENPF